MDYGHSDEPGNPGVAKTYLNGAPIQTSTITDTIRVEQTTNYQIGNANLKASVQNARLYNVAFTDAEVLALYNAVDSESGAVVINMENIVPLIPVQPSAYNPAFSVPVSAFAPSWSQSGLPAGLSIDSGAGAIAGIQWIFRGYRYRSFCRHHGNQWIR